MNHNGIRLQIPYLQELAANTSANNRSSNCYWSRTENDDEVNCSDHWLRSLSREKRMTHVRRQVGKVDAEIREAIKTTSFGDMKICTSCSDTRKLRACLPKEPHFSALLLISGHLASLRTHLCIDARWTQKAVRGKGGYHAMEEHILVIKRLRPARR